LSEELKQPFVEMAEGDKIRYEKELRDIIDTKIAKK